MEEGTTPQNNNMMVMGGIVVLIVLLVAGFFFMKSKGSTNTTQPIVEEQTETVPAESTETTTTEESSTEATTNETVQTVTLEAGSFYYKPATITVKKGQKVKIVLKSVDMMHDFNIDELNVKIPITKSGETAEVEFTADTAGRFEYYCSVGQHRKQGQVGTLIVE